MTDETLALAEQMRAARLMVAHRSIAEGRGTPMQPVMLGRRVAAYESIALNVHVVEYTNAIN